MRRRALSGSSPMSSWPGGRADVAGGGEAPRISAYASSPTGVAGGQDAGQRGSGIVSGHPDGAGDLLSLGVQPDHFRRQLAETGPNRYGRAAVGTASSPARTPATGGVELY